MDRAGTQKQLFWDGVPASPLASVQLTRRKSSRKSRKTSRMKEFEEMKGYRSICGSDDENEPQIDSSHCVVDGDGSDEDVFVVKDNEDTVVQGVIKALLNNVQDEIKTLVHEYDDDNVEIVQGVIEADDNVEIVQGVIEALLNNVQVADQGEIESQGDDDNDHKEEASAATIPQDIESQVPTMGDEVDDCLESSSTTAADDTQVSEHSVQEVHNTAISAKPDLLPAGDKDGVSKDHHFDLPIAQETPTVGENIRTPLRAFDVPLDAELVRYRNPAEIEANRLAAVARRDAIFAQRNRLQLDANSRSSAQQLQHHEQEQSLDEQKDPQEDQLKQPQQEEQQLKQPIQQEQQQQEQQKQEQPLLQEQQLQQARTYVDPRELNIGSSINLS